MDKKTTDIVAYITILGWLAAYVAGEKEESKFHLNQGLVINLAFIILAFLTRIPLVGILAGLLQIGVFVFWVMGLIYAVREQDNEVPLLGCIKLLK
ncbi:MAG: hypothetical protein HFH85_00605 [Lachnospiraceae bacterium]|jgi:uncharacterized membrane protein|nr:hypothetical protein [Lachnospiraceae bacterium]